MTTRTAMQTRDGFALPFTIFLVTMITIMLAAAFTRSAAEHQIADSNEATVTTLAVAQTGLQAFFGDTFTVRPQPGDSFRYNVVGGYAWVAPQELQRPADTVNRDVVYAVRSTGYLIVPTQGEEPQATRTIVQFARWQIGSMSPPALLTAANGVQRRAPLPPDPNAGILWALAADNNECSTGRPSRPRLRIPSSPPSAPVIDWPWSGGPVIQAGTRAAVAGETGIDWDEIVNGDFTADYTSVQYGDTTFSSQLINGNLSLASGSTGSGLLIVTGNLTTAGTGAPVVWRGVVLVGGFLTANAAVTEFRGVVMTGLNELLGTAVTTPNQVAGTVPPLGGQEKEARFYYEPCYVSRALDPFTGWVPVTNAWVDNWATY